MENNSEFCIEIDKSSANNSSWIPLKDTNVTLLPNKKNKRKNTSPVHEYFTKYVDTVRYVNVHSWMNKGIIVEKLIKMSFLLLEVVLILH